MNNSILVIMAGGKSSRMQQDKALLPFNGYSSLAQYQYEKFKPLFKEVYISAKENKFDFSVDIIEDCYSESSPLVSLVSIFETLKDIDEVMIVTVDAPFVDYEVFQALYKKAEKEDIITVAQSPNGVEPLCAIYKRGIMDVAKKMLKENRHRLQTLLDSVKSKRVFFSNKEIFMNLNYPSDYELAKRLSSNI